MLSVAVALGWLAATPSDSAADEARFPAAKLMTGEALPDVPQGRADAPITMIEYASLICTHCARVHASVWPTLLKEYVETGKVRFILREFPYEPLSTAAFMLARCEGSDKRNAVIDLLFDTQASWAFGDKPLEAMEATLRQTGMGHAAFEACLQNQTLYDQVMAVHDRAESSFGVHATPTFFIDGTKVTGEIDASTLRKILDAAEAKKS